MRKQGSHPTNNFLTSDEAYRNNVKYYESGK